MTTETPENPQDMPRSFFPKRASASFFIPQERRTENVLTAAQVSGVERVRITPDGYVVGHWAFFGCELLLEERPRHQLFEIQFLEILLRDRLPLIEDLATPIRLEDDPLYPMALAFRDACIGLKPEVAFITHRPHQDPHWVREQSERDVLEGDIRSLLFDMLVVYMDSAYAKRHWNDWEWYALEIPELIERHDVMQVEGGAIVFHGKGTGRWLGGGAD